MISIVKILENSVTRGNIISMASGHHPNKMGSSEEKKPKVQEQQKISTQQQNQEVVQHQPMNSSDSNM